MGISFVIPICIFIYMIDFSKYCYESLTELDIDYNVMFKSMNKYNRLDFIDKQTEFKTLLVHSDCRDYTGDNISKSIDDNYELKDDLSKLDLSKNWKPMLTGYNVNKITDMYEEGGWAGVGEIIYYTDKYDYQNHWAGKLPKDPIFEYIEWSNGHKGHPLVQIHYRVIDDNDWLELKNVITKCPNANIVLCHGGFEAGDPIDIYNKRLQELNEMNNVKIEVSFYLLSEFVNSPKKFIEFKNYCFGTDCTPYVYDYRTRPYIEIQQKIKRAKSYIEIK